MNAPAHAVVLFLSAFLLFLIQPIAGKTLLPWFGGAPAVWTTCLFFFQSLLLAGYACTHLVARLRPRFQAGLYLTFLAVTLVQIPIAISEEWKPDASTAPVPQILAILSFAIGTPYVFLAATTPLLQQWVSRDAHAGVPYRLYSVSNAGSLVALLTYPFIWEPRLTQAGQTLMWSALYGVVGVMAALLALWHSRGQTRVSESDERSFAPEVRMVPSRRDRLLWFFLAASASGLLAATTNEMCLDVAAVPFLWVVPLALYLLTFVLAFGGVYRRSVIGALFAVSAVAVGAVMRLAPSVPIAWQIGALSLALFAGAWLCHGELVRRAPDSQHVTVFYLAIAAGGAAGTFATLAAPVVFSGFWEVPIFLSLTTILFLRTILWESPLLAQRKRWLAWAALVAAPAVVIAVFAWPRAQSSSSVAAARNFYGVLRVVDDTSPQTPLMRRLRHGRILHGMQFLDPARRGQPTSYYAADSGIGRVIQGHPTRTAGGPLRIGVIGLGAGTIAALGTRGDRITFYEINPQVIEFARDYFTFLEDSEAAIEIVPGDARLSIEREVARGPIDRLDVLAVDAFSGDAVPVHLLTRESAALYWQALREDGVLAVHTTNRHLDLVPVVRGMAEAAGKIAVFVGTATRPEAGVSRSDWVLITSNQTVLAEVSSVGRRLDKLASRPALVWTDSFSNLLDVLR